MSRKPLLAVLALAAVATQGAAQQSRAFRSQPIRAGVLTLRSTKGAGLYETPSAAPFAFYNLDNALSVKPAEWVFENPNNEGVLSDATRARWSAIDPVAVARVPAGGRVQKRYAPYWEVSLANASDADLAQYDVLLLAPVGFVQLTPEERAKLERFVDGGGVLWVDIDTGLADISDSVNSFPVPFAVQTGLPLGGTDLFSPLLSAPLPLTINDVARINDPIDAGTTAAGMVQVPTGSSVDALLSRVVGDRAFGRFVPVATQGAAPNIATARLGDGYMVVTVTGVAQKLNRTISDTDYRSNIQFLASAPKLTQQGVSVAKFATNLISLVASAHQFGGAGRHQFSSGIDIGAPLLQRFRAEYPGGTTYMSPATSLRPPVVYKGLLFVATDDRILCYDVDPKRDADGDGDPDDGLPDLRAGTAEDKIFQTVAIAGGISSVTATEVADPVPGGPRDLLMVTSGNGSVHLFPVYGNVAGGVRRWPTTGDLTEEYTPVAPPTAATGSVATGSIFSPTVHDGVAFIVDKVAGSGLGAGDTGRLRVVNLRTGAALTSPGTGTPFVAGGATAAIPEPTGPATVGEIPILDNSGGSDVVAYIPVKGQNSGGNQTGPGIVSYWFGVKGEKPFQVEVAGGAAVLTTRASTQGGLPIYIPTATSDPLGVRITLVRKDGTVYTQAQLASVFTGFITDNGSGQLTLGLQPAYSAALPNDVDPANPIRIDYTIDWAKAGAAAASIERGRILFNDATGERRILGGVAMGPQGTIFASVSNQAIGGVGTPTGGTVYALKEEGRGAFRMAWRWDLYPRHTLAYEGGSTTYESVLPDNDPVQNLKFGGFSLSNVLGGRLTDMALQGPPVVRGDKVFVSVSGRKAANFFRSPASALLCFSAEPPSPELRVDLDLSGGFSIAQPDFARSGDPTNPRVFSVLSSTPQGNAAEAVSFEKAATGVGGTIRFASLASARNGQIVDSISLSQPILLRRQGQSDILVEPSAQGRWSPLQWYTIFHGTTLYGPPFAAGNTLYAAGTSTLPSFFGNPGVFPPTSVGYLTAVRTDVDIQNALPTTQSYTTNTANFTPRSVVADAGRPWLRQLNSLDYPRATNAYGSEQADLGQIYNSPEFVLPQNPRNTQARGRTTFDDYRLRVLQATLTGTGGLTPAVFGVVGGDRALVAWNGQATYAFTRSDFWIADEGRIARVDPSGNVLFDSRASFRLGETGGSAAGTVVPLVRPTRVIPVQGDDDLLVVDSGANKILRTDPSGVVSREISAISVDPNFAPNGYRNNEALGFKNPRDVATFTTRVLAADNVLTTPAPLEEWTHYLVADEGNSRLVEVVDRVEIDANTGNRLRYVGEPATLLWHSPAQVSGKGFDYNSISRVALAGSGGTTRYAFVAGIGSVAPGRQDAGETPPRDTTGGAAGTPPTDGSDSTGGGVVVFDPTLPAGVVVYNSVEVPAIPGTARPFFGGDRATQGSALAIGQGQFGTATADLPAQTVAAGNAHRFAGVASVTASPIPIKDAAGNITDTVIGVMVADRTGVYEAIPAAAPVTGDANRTVLQTRWMITDEAFRAMRRTQVGGVGSADFIVSADAPARLNPAYARRLDDESVILVNGYVGSTFGNYDVGLGQIVGRRPFTGEVLQLDGRLDGIVRPRGTIGEGYNVQNDNLGFDLRSIRVRFGPTEGARGILQPVFADRR